MFGIFLKYRNEEVIKMDKSKKFLIFLKMIFLWDYWLFEQCLLLTLFKNFLLPFDLNLGPILSAYHSSISEK